MSVRRCPCKNKSITSCGLHFLLKCSIQCTKHWLSWFISRCYRAMKISLQLSFPLKRIYPRSSSAFLSSLPLQNILKCVVWALNLKISRENTIPFIFNKISFAHAHTNDCLICWINNENVKWIIFWWMEIELNWMKI